MIRAAAKIALSVAAMQYGFIPPLVDFSESHVFHPDWPPHARFHLVWLLGLGAALAAYVLGEIWIVSKGQVSALRRVSVLGFLVLGAFCVAAAFRSHYGGSLTDAAEPLLLLGIDGNVFSFAVASGLQIFGSAVVWRAPG